MTSKDSSLDKRRQLAAETAGNDVWVARINAVGTWLMVLGIELIILASALAIILR